MLIDQHTKPNTPLTNVKIKFASTMRRRQDESKEAETMFPFSEPS